MALGHGEDGGLSDGHISDKTLYIALNYQLKADKMNTDLKEEIVEQLVELEQEQRRLEYYISLLEQRQAEVIRFGYFENLPWENVAAKIGVALRTVRKIRDDAVEELVRMYDFTNALQ